MVALGEEAAKHAPTVAKHALISKHAPVDGKKFYVAYWDPLCLLQLERTFVTKYYYWHLKDRL